MTQPTNENETQNIQQLTANIATAYLGQNAVGPDQIQSVIVSISNALAGIGPDGTSANAEPEAKEPQKPAVPIKKSINDDYLVCLEDGKKLKMLKRHLRTTYGMTPEEYRAKWNLPSDYPMVSPNYAKQRSEFAKKIGLGRKSEDEAAE